LLHATAWHGQKQGVELLLAHGADVSAKTGDGQTPLDIALGLGHRDIVRLLSSSGGKFGVTKNVGKQWIEK